MVERITSEQDLRDYMGERHHSQRLRNAITFCKSALELGPQINDRNLKAEERLGFERCLTENFLVKKGMDYFGKRDLIYIDLYGTDDLRNLNSSI